MLLAEAAVFAAGLALIFGHTAHRRTRTARLLPRVHAARAVVARTLAGDQNNLVLPRLPLDQAVLVLAGATRSVDVTARGRLAALPTYAGLTVRAGRWCASRRWPRRLKGVRLLTILGAGEDTVPPLLDDPRAEVRSAAAAWMTGHPAPEGISRLLGMLNDESLSCRLAAQAALIRLGRHTLASVTAHLMGPEPAALASILAVASRLNDPVLRDPVLAYRGHPDPAVRAGVAGVLTSFGGVRAVDALEGFLDDPAATVRAAAATGLGAIGHWPSAPMLAGRLGDPAWEVRRAAGLALHSLSGPGRLYLQRAGQSPDPFTSDMARQVLDLPVRAVPGLQEH